MTSSDTSIWDAIVIGGGHNGLVCAALLAKSGRKVVVLEASDTFGGGARTEEFSPGFHVSSLAHVLNRLHPDVVRELELETQDVAHAEGEAMPSIALSTRRDPVIFAGAYGERLLGDVAPGDRVGWAELRALLLRQAGVLKPFLSKAPPPLDGLSLADASSLGLAALNLRKLGREDMRDFLRMALMNVADVLDEFLDDDRLKGLLAFDAVLGAHLGPRSPTSLLGLYYRLCGEAGAQAVPVGGMGRVAAALEAGAIAAGCTLRRAAPVARIGVENGAATGVTLADGEEIRAPVVVSAINPRTTFLDLVGTRALNTGFVRRVGTIRMRGDAAKLHLALDRPPAFIGVGGNDMRGRLVIAPSVDHVERAFNPSKYGEFSPAPVMEITLPSVADPTLAPDGACVLSAVVQYAPYALKEGWEAGRPKFLEAILTTLEDHAPGLRGSILHAELLTPADIEARWLMPGGHWHHGELQIDQMLVNRPVHGAERYATPIDGLFLAGAGSHPGGGISGAPGLLAARRIMGRG